MKILQINKYFYPKGGSETVFFNTISLLKAFGHEIIPFALRDEKNKPSGYDEFFVDYPELSDSNISTKLKTLPNFIYNRSAAKQLERLILKEKPDVAHIHLMFNSHSVAILPILKKYNIPTVMTAHDYRLICPAYLLIDKHGNVCERCLKAASYWHCAVGRCSHGSFFNSALLSLDSYFQKYFLSPLKYIDHFIFVSHFSQNKHVEGNLKFENKSTVLHNFTQVARTGVSPEKEEYILFFGRISEEKGVSTLLDAMKDLPSVQLKVIGAGPLLEYYKQKETINVEFLGFKSGDELYQYIQRARFVIVPSECYENSPMSIIESMTLGTPVIASNIGGIPELVRDSENGFLFESKSVSSLKKVIQKAINLDEDDYLNLCNNSYAESERFSPQKNYEGLLSIYSQLISNKQ